MTSVTTTKLAQKLSRWRREAVQVSWTVAKIAAWLLVIAWLVGLPGSWFQQFIAPHAKPYEASISRLTWNPLRGFIAHSIRIRESGHEEHILQARLAVFRPDYAALIRGNIQLITIEIEDGQSIFTMRAEEAVDRISAIHLHDVQARIVVFPDQFDLSIQGTSELGTRIDAGGSILRLPPVSTAEDLPSAPANLTALEQVRDHIAHAPAWLASMHERARKISFSGPLLATIEFFITPGNPEATLASLVWRAPGFTVEGRTFDSAELLCRLENRVVEITRASVGIGGEQLIFEGVYAWTNDLFNARFYGDLPPDRVEMMLPGRVRRPVDEWGIKWEGLLHAEGWIGPCGLADIPRNWSGWLSLQNGKLNDVPVQKAFAAIKRTPSSFTLQDGLIQAGRGAGAGSASFGIAVDFEQKQIEGQFTIGIELQQLDAVLTRGLRQVAAMFEIPEQPVTIDGSFAMPFGNSDALVVRGDIRGTNFLFRGVPVRTAQVGLVYTNDIVKLDPFITRCESGEITGSLVLDLDRDIYDIDLEVTAHPQQVAPMAGTNFARYFNPYRFTDEIMIRAQGRVDAGDDSGTDLSIHASGRRIGYSKFTADHLLLQGHRTTGLLQLTNVVASIAQGTVTGSVIITHAPEIDRFDASLVASNLAIDAIAAMLNPETTNRYEGWIRGQIDLAGAVPDTPEKESLNGTGTFSIENGRLLMIPLFGGLSSLLGKIYPGLGFSEQTSAAATLRITDGIVRTDDLKVGGNLLSLSAKGACTMNGNLDFDVQVHPFRDGSVASAVRVVTLPISMLLEFHVTGSLTNPAWNARNIPLL